ncbi:MAG: urease accessory protein UreF [Rhodospirillaceae bacterium]|nr:MAG: urease accessory protein UreF [Rhodospirillaceae bacterium]
MATPIPITDSGLLRLMTWLSPSFPVGAYAYSHGSEFAVESGQLLDRKSALSWIAFVLEFGSGRVDADLFVAAYLAADENNIVNFLKAANMANALKGTAELGLESRAQGQAFLDTVLMVWPDERLKTFALALTEQNIQPSYSIAVAAAAAFAGVGLQAALGAYLHAFTANIASAVVRLVPLGQTDGQRIIAAIEPVIERALVDALERDPNDMGSAAFGVDLMSMKHETQYSRLFRS